MKQVATKPVAVARDASREVTVQAFSDGELVGQTHMPYFTAIGYVALMERNAPDGVQYSIVA